MTLGAVNTITISSIDPKVKSSASSSPYVLKVLFECPHCGEIYFGYKPAMCYKCGNPWED